MTHPYFIAKARETFAAAGGDPDRSAALAVWAEEARNRKPRPQGVIVAQDGTLLAETRHYHFDGATYVVQALVPEAAALVNWEIGLAVGHARRLVGQPAAHVKTSRLCFGAGVYVRQV